MKGIIEIDMPKSCSECEFNRTKNWLPLSEGTTEFYCNKMTPRLTHKVIIGSKVHKLFKFTQCPIKPKEETNERK